MLILKTTNLYQDYMCFLLDIWIGEMFIFPNIGAEILQILSRLCQSSHSFTFPKQIEVEELSLKQKYINSTL